MSLNKIQSTILLLFYLLLTLSTVSQHKNDIFKIDKKGGYFSVREIDNYAGKIAVIHYVASEDSLLVLDLTTNKSITLPGFSGKVQDFLINKEKGYLSILTAFDYSKTG